MVLVRRFFGRKRNGLEGDDDTTTSLAVPVNAWRALSLVTAVDDRAILARSGSP